DLLELHAASGDVLGILSRGRKQAVGNRRLHALDHESIAETEPAYKTHGYEVPPEQQKNTFDPLSAVMFLTSGVAVSADNPCGVTAPVFDGRRRYNIELAKIKDTTISMDNGLYKGHGVVCSVKYRQLAGFKPNIIKQNQNFPPVEAWVAVFPSAVSGHHYV